MKLVILEIYKGKEGFNLQTSDKQAEDNWGPISLRGQKL